MAAILILYVVALELLFRITFFAHEYTLAKVLSWEMVFYYLPFFLMGILYKMYLDRLRPVLLNKNTALVATVMFVLFVAAEDALIDLYDKSWLMLFFCTRILALVSAHYFIYKIFSVSIVAESKLSVALCYIGKMTLEIYLLHNFAMRIILKSILLHWDWAAKPHGLLFDFLLYFGNGIFVTGACIAIVYMMKRIRIYPFLFPSTR